MSDEIKNAVENGMKGLQDKLDAAIAKHDGQVQESGKAAKEALDAVKALAAQHEKAITELAQKFDTADKGDSVELSAGAEFVKSEQYAAFVRGDRTNARVEVKNTVTSAATTVFPQQQPGIIQGSFAPVTLRSVIPSVKVSGNAVNSLREASWTNSAREVTQGAAKPESDITFEAYNVTIETVAHWIKVTKQLMADAPAVMSYINVRLRDGLAQRIDRQLFLGNGTTPNLSGLIDSGNYTAYSLAASGDTLVDAINKAKYALWAATGEAPDVAIVNPADWGAMERTREGAASGMYLYGAPGQMGGSNPFGVQIVLSNNITAGNILVGNVGKAAVLYEREGAVVEMGYVNTDFTQNLVTIRAEERLGLGVERPSLLYYGDFEA